jgi:DNA-binding NarL/FixJ family response regulator
VGITVLIADDHALVRQALRGLLEIEEDVQVVGEASTGIEVLEMMEHRPAPDVVLMDVRMPAMDGLETARRIRNRSPSVAVIMLSAYDDHHFVVEAVRAGALGYLLKTEDAEYLIKAVRLAVGGNMFIDSRVVTALAGELAAAGDRDRKAQTLTTRELEVLQLLAFGRTNKDIAHDLAISPAAVKTLLEHVFAKLGASDRTAAVAAALRRQLIE